MKRLRHGLALGACVLLLGACATPSEPVVAETPTSRALAKLPRKSGDRVAVTIYEFRSGVNGVNAQAATDMFKTALVKSGQFRVVERARVAEGVVREKQMNAQGLTTGTTAQQPLRGADYVFEGTVSEANANTRQKSGGVNILGMDVGGGTNTDVIAIDVRIVSAANGDVLDAITVKMPIASTQAGVSGVGNAVSNVLARKGRDTTYVPDARAQTGSREGVDAALRACIDKAVLELSQRFAP